MGSRWGTGDGCELNVLGTQYDHHGRVSSNTGGVSSLSNYYVDCLPYAVSLSRVLGKDTRKLLACKLH